MELRITELDDIKKELSSMQQIILALVETGKVKKTVGIADVARMEGISRTSICGKERYLLPRFGESGYPTGSIRWDIDEYLKWRKIPAEERERAWHKQLDEERRRYVASRKSR